MYGTGEVFEYFECAQCGALSIIDIPEDLSSHYGGSYYSMAAAGQRDVRRAVRRVWDRLCALNTVRLGGRLDWLLGRLHHQPAILSWPVFQRVGLAGRILDVGCGAGVLLDRLADMGFRNLTGIDPFLDERLVREGRVTLRRTGIEQMVGTFDLVMFNHSFEHVLDADATLAAARDRLAVEGRLLLRVPVGQGVAWRRFGVEWAQLDPPRHIVIHTEASIRALAERNGLELENVFYDSTAFQFWGSAQVQNGIALQSPSSHAVDPSRSTINREQMEKYRSEAESANQRSDGDQAGFVLRRASPLSAGSGDVEHPLQGDL